MSSRELSESARDRLLSAARVLFYNDGIAATGIDAIVKRAGVAKKSLYNNFASKAELVATYLQIRHEEWLALYANRLQQAASPKERVMAVFLAYEDHAEFAYERGFRGCGLLNAAAELPAGAPGRQAVRGHKEQVESILNIFVCFSLVMSNVPYGWPGTFHFYSRAVCLARVWKVMVSVFVKQWQWPPT